MTRLMYDSTQPGAIPEDAEMVAGYLSPSPYAWSVNEWDRFPNAVQVRIAVRASTNDGHVLDVEKGDATPAEAPGWVSMRRTAGADPSVYCSMSSWPAVMAAFVAAGVKQPHYWVAAYPGIGDNVPTGAVAHQFADSLSSGGDYDLSAVLDFWPGVDMTDPTELNIAGFVYAGGASTRAAAPGVMPSGVDATSTFGRIVNLQGAIANLTSLVSALIAAQNALAASVASLKAAQALTGTATVTLDLSEVSSGA